MEFSRQHIELFDQGTDSLTALEEMRGVSFSEKTTHEAQIRDDIIMIGLDAADEHVKDFLCLVATIDSFDLFFQAD